MTVHEAIKVILSDKAKYATSINYAVNYCRHALTIADTRELQTQCLRIRCNITHWRHPQAKEVRQTLKNFAARK